MNILSGWGARARGLFADNKGPWGSSGGSDDEPTSSDGGSSGGPWGDPGRKRKGRSSSSESNPTLDEFFRRSRERFSGGGLPGRPDASIFVWAIIGLVLLWLIFTSMHSIAPAQRGVVTRFGRYSYTLQPGVGITLPSPIDRVKKVDVDNIRTADLGGGTAEDLMLTGDQNLIDIAYTVRWKISSPELYLFQLADPQTTIKQVAESSMRAVISRVTLRDAMGDRRAEIETQVAEGMQRILNGYRGGIQIQGVAIKQADPPDAVNDAFKQVTAAQQDAKSYINQANAYALQITAKAQGDATSFDKVYEQYKLAPDVTRRRMYYETMEQVLSKVDKTIVEAPGVTPYLPLPQVQKEQKKESAQ